MRMQDIQVGQVYAYQRGTWASRHKVRVVEKDVTNPGYRGRGVRIEGVEIDDQDLEAGIDNRYLRTLTTQFCMTRFIKEPWLNYVARQRQLLVARRAELDARRDREEAAAREEARVRNALRLTFNDNDVAIGVRKSGNNWQVKHDFMLRICRRLREVRGLADRIDEGVDEAITGAGGAGIGMGTVTGRMGR